MSEKCKVTIEIDEELAKILDGSIRMIALDMDNGDIETYFDDSNPDYDKDDEEWEIADDYESRNGYKLRKFLKRLLVESGAGEKLLGKVYL